MTDAARPRRTGRWIAVVVVVVVLLAGLAVAAEFIARSIVTGTVRTLVVQQVGLPDDQQVDVDVPGIVLPQVIAGRLDDVAVSSDDVALGPLTGDVRVRLEGVPISGDAAAAGGEASVRLDEAQLRALLAGIDGLPADAVSIAAPDLQFATEVTVLGLAIPIGVELAPGVADGDLTLTPTSFQLAGNDIDADSLRGQLGGLADGLVATRNLCIADQLPAGLTLTSVTVQGSDVVAGLAIDGGIIVDPALQENGTCG